MRQTGKLVQENLPALHPAEASRMQCVVFTSMMFICRVKKGVTFAYSY